MTPVLAARARRESATDKPPLPPLSARMQLVRSVMVLVLAMSAGLVLHVGVISSLQQRASQQRAFERLRRELAEGTAPLGPATRDGHELRRGAPVAYLEIPSLKLKQVVVEGTGAGDLFIGPGHRRDTPLPGQPGVSVLLGRKASFGGPFRDLHELRGGSMIRVTTAQGKFQYRVTGARRAGDPAPPPLASGAGRLLLVTASGSPFLPQGVLRVDAELVDKAVPGVSRAIATGSLPASEQIMGTDSTTLWALVLWLQGLLAMILIAAWAWRKLGRARTWVILLPPLALVALSASGEAARLLPNLL